ncbi:MAG: TerB family tellurite resistance protein [Candidatus Poseidonia sp.]|nr:TerB family tellurite resistance protein [Poseidonia sp.]
MFPDGMGQRPPSEMVRYAEVLVHLAASDGELVREEIAVIEALMGRAMIHPESRVTVRAGFEQPIPLEQSLADLDPGFVRFILRDAALVAAVDGAYDRKELKALRTIAKAAEMSTEQLSEVLDWVTEGWHWFSSFENIQAK